MSDEPSAHYGNVVCLQCTKQFNRAQGYQKHAQSHAGTLYESPSPGCTDKREHYEAANPAQDSYPCDADGCTDTFLDVSTLIKHRVLSHPHIQRPVDVVKDDATRIKGVSESPEPLKEQSPPPGDATTSVILDWSHGTLVCPQCAKEFGSTRSYRIHAWKHDSNPKRLECAWPDCTFYSFSRNAVKKHFVAVHLRLRIHRCNIDRCTAAYSERYHLIKHQKKWHPGTEGQMYPGEKPKKIEIDESIYIKGYPGPLGEQSPLVGDAPTPAESEDVSESLSISSDNIPEGALMDSENTSRVRLPSISGVFEGVPEGSDSEQASQVRLPRLRDVLPEYFPSNWRNSSPIV